MAKVRIRLALAPETASRMEGMRIQFGDVAGGVVGVDDIGDGTYAVLVEPFEWKDRAGWNVQLRLNDRMCWRSAPTLVALAEMRPAPTAAADSKRGRDAAWCRLAERAERATGSG